MNNAQNKDPAYVEIE